MCVADLSELLHEVEVLLVEHLLVLAVLGALGAQGTVSCGVGRVPTDGTLHLHSLHLYITHHTTTQSTTTQDTRHKTVRHQRHREGGGGESSLCTHHTLAYTYRQRDRHSKAKREAYRVLVPSRRGLSKAHGRVRRVRLSLC